jgi:sterol desaturase/sphingolipid hydroxylase (fatty acid hydroxylase superfamily)
MPDARRSSPAGRLAMGLGLVFGPVALLAGVLAWTGSAIAASVAALSASSTFQLAAEWLRPRHRLPERSSRQLGVEIFQGIVYGTALGVGVTFGLWWLALQARAALGIDFAVGGGVLAQALLLVVVADFVDYFRHRHEHETHGLFWRVHSVHHSIRSFSLLSGLALHPLETVFTYASYGVVAGALGLPFESMLIGFTFALIVMGAQHTNTDSGLGWLSTVLAHTDGHRWHHDVALESGRNVNYANVLPLWDLLWGSYYAPRDFDGEYGIAPFWDAYPKDLVGQARMVLPAHYAAAEAAARAAGRR